VAVGPPLGDANADVAGATGSTSNSSSVLQQLSLYDNIHIRVSVKNYANEISGTPAETLLRAVDTECEPARAAGGGGSEKLRVTILLNVGKGLLEPFCDVDRSTGYALRSGSSADLPAHHFTGSGFKLPTKS
jgi:hypothetical protein